MTLRIAIITVSDRASQGIYADASGPAARDALMQVLQQHPVDSALIIVPDEPAELRKALQECVAKQFDVIFTTGGTGIGPRDITPEVTRSVIEKEIPGIGEALRAFSMEITKNAMLSRATAGIAGRSLVVNLPGSPRAVKEIVAYLGETLVHAHAMMQGVDIHE